MNNPFKYIPSVQMLAEQKTLVEQIDLLCKKDSAFCEDVSKGKMFGILITDKDIIYAYSGQICGRSDWEGFVPAVFDYLQEDGYFKTHETEITAINNEIGAFESAIDYAQARNTYNKEQQSAREDIERYKQIMKASKLERDMLRSSGGANPADLIKESQYMKAELHRKKQIWKQRLEEAESKVNEFESRIRLLKLQRQHKSDHLQRWLFEQFVFTSLSGEDKNLLQIWHPELPPAGSGECCEPKLLHYAISHGMQPIEMGMFWWGDSPRQEIRHHMHFYPACNSKCKPILQYILDSNVQFDDDGNAEKELDIIYEDDAIIVIDKPSGMLSVPGKDDKPSVYSLLKARHPHCPTLQMVHRLDMDTSGLLVVAKTDEAHKLLQQQFAMHSNSKTYIALLERNIDGNGEIMLPLRPDYTDRPRQLVDFENGKFAHTIWKAMGGNRIELTLKTGRTHQLRVHCAHRQGLNNPIKGDRLYGNEADRLYLHAYRLVLVHPVTGELMTFTSKPPF